MNYTKLNCRFAHNTNTHLGTVLYNCVQYYKTNTFRYTPYHPETNMNSPLYAYFNIAIIYHNIVAGNEILKTQSQPGTTVMAPLLSGIYNVHSFCSFHSIISGIIINAFSVLYIGTNTSIHSLKFAILCMAELSKTTAGWNVFSAHITFCFGVYYFSTTFYLIGFIIWYVYLNGVLVLTYQAKSVNSF